MRGISIINLGGDWHAHKCDACATVWQHKTCHTCSEADYAALHDCPKCGKNQRVKLPIGGKVNFDRPPLPENTANAIGEIIADIARWENEGGAPWPS